MALPFRFHTKIYYAFFIIHMCAKCTENLIFLDVTIPKICSEGYVKVSNGVKLKSLWNENCSSPSSFCHEKVFAMAMAGSSSYQRRLKQVNSQPFPRVITPPTVSLYLFKYPAAECDVYFGIILTVSISILETSKWANLKWPNIAV
jgi:hypothetical protein